MTYLQTMDRLNEVADVMACAYRLTRTDSFVSTFEDLDEVEIYLDEQRFALTESKGSVIVKKGDVVVVTVPREATSDGPYCDIWPIVEPIVHARQ